MKLLKKLYQILASRRRRRAFRKIRREFARAGYRLDKFRDSQIEAALRHWNNDVSQVTVNAKTIYRTLKRLKVNQTFPPRLVKEWAQKALPQKSQNIRFAAPTARNMKARGKREPKRSASPLVKTIKNSSPERA
jgi:hypothetical protein